MPHSTDIHVGRKVRETRIAKGMSQQQLGATLGVSFQQVQKYEKGSNRIGSSRLYAIAQTLEVPVSYLFDGLGGTADESFTALPRRTIKLAKQIDSIPDENIRGQVLNLIKACAA